MKLFHDYEIVLKDGMTMEEVLNVLVDYSCPNHIGARLSSIVKTIEGEEEDIFYTLTFEGK